MLESEHSANLINTGRQAGRSESQII